MEVLFYIALVMASFAASKLLFTDRSTSFVFVTALAILFAFVGLSTFVSAAMTTVSLAIALLMCLGLITIFTAVTRITAREFKARLSSFSFTAVDRCFLITFFSISGVVALIVKANPIPPGNAVDAAAHFAVVKYFLDYATPPGGHWNFLWEIAYYPYGFHVNDAILSRVLNTPAISVLWILPAVLVSFCVSICTAMIWEVLSVEGLSLRSKVLTCCFAAFFLYASPYTLEPYTGSGFYPMTMAMFIVLVITWMTAFYPLNLSAVLVFSVCLSFMPITYPQWGPFLCFYFAFLVYRSTMKTPVKLIALLSAALPAAVVGFDFVLSNWKGLSYIFHVEGWCKRDPVFVFGLFGCAVIGLMYSVKQRTSNLVVLLAACLLEAALLIASKAWSGVGAFYHLYKFAYILIPMAAVLVCTCATSLIKSSRRFVGGAIYLLCGLLALMTLKHSAGHVLTNDDLDVFSWVEHNVVQPSIGIIDTNEAASPYALWGYALTGKPSSIPVPEWWVQPGESFQTWLDRSSENDVAVVRTGLSEFKSTEAAQILYSKGRTFVIQKRNPASTPNGKR